MSLYQNLNHQYTLMYEEFNHYLDMYTMNDNDQNILLDWMDQFDGHRYYKYIYCYVVQNIMDKYRYNTSIVIGDIEIPACDG